MITEPAHFDVTGELPSGTTVLEASAGTGKTYTIVNLAARFVAEEGIRMSELLLVTFTTAATSELRDRTRHHFAAEIARLSDATDEKLITQRRRLARAIAEFDDSTIVTTHSFCDRMLESLGIVADKDRMVTFVEEPEEIMVETIDDLYIAEFAEVTTRPAFAETAKAAKEAVRDRHAELVQHGAGSAAQQLTTFADAARKEVERRKRLYGVSDYADQLELLAETLGHETVGPIACARIRARFKIVLIDEFQDTDPLQWDILTRAFHGHTRMVLVGDPKQAIYGFRGAEVRSYLSAVKVADSQVQLGKNWRSDVGLLTALHHLWGNAALGEEEIVVRKVAAAKSETRLSSGAAMRLRYLAREGLQRRKDGLPTKPALRNRISADVAADIVRLLESGTTFAGDKIRAGDITVLVRYNYQAEAVRTALLDAEVPCVYTGSSSVLRTDAATEWLEILCALEQPARAGLVRRAALTDIVGWSVEQLDSGGELAVADLATQFREFAAIAGDRGFAAMFDQMASRWSLTERMLSLKGGERTLTDIRHTAEVLNREWVESGAGVAVLTRWLRERVEDSSFTADDRSRRLDSDASAVQIATIHVSKGLEFPVVYVPFGWDLLTLPPKSVKYHEGDRRVIDVGGDSSQGYAGRLQRARDEEVGEELRLLYVALTRAKSQVVMWWAPSTDTPGSPLHRMLFGRTTGAPGIPARAAVPDDATVAAHLTRWAAGAGGHISLERVDTKPPKPHTLVDYGDDPKQLEVARFSRTLDMTWQRTSYSRLTKAAHDKGHSGSEPEVRGVDDEPDHQALAATAGGIASPFNSMPGGASFGTLVHEILEYVDTDASDLGAELENHCRLAVSTRITTADPVALAKALHVVMQTPLGYGSLASIPPRDRLSELDFELPLHDSTLAAIEGLFRRHIVAPDPLAAYCDELRKVGDAPLRGFLTGSIDAVVRAPDGRYWVLDYKTNRIGSGDLTVGNYAPEAMATEMMRSNYPLQAILYCVALHRYLRWRRPGYDPDAHLGGAQYLFVRGMVGVETPAGHGVFEWHPPTDLITELSAALGGER